MAGLATALAVAAAGIGGARRRSAVRPADARQLAGQRVVTGFTGHTPPRDLLRRIRRGKVGGVILFGHNVASRSQVARMVRRLQSVRRPRALDEPLLVMVDQEGGPVRRIPGAPERSAAADRRDRPRERGPQGRACGRAQPALRRVNVDLAPVADVARPGSAMERERRCVRPPAAQGRALRGRVRGGPAADGRARHRQALPRLRRGAREHRPRARDHPHAAQAAAPRSTSAPTARCSGAASGS